MIRAPGAIGLDLKHAPDVMAARGGSLGRPLYLLASTTSSSDEARRAAKAGAPHGATWVVEEQTAGRGRQGRTWWAPAGESLLFSVLVRYEDAPSRLPQVAILAGLAVHEAVSRAAPDARVQLKWPNDVVVASAGGQKKVSGILVEAITAGSRVEAVVIGVGVNVHTRAFPDPIAERSTSVALLSSAGAPAPDRAEILANILSALDRDLHVVASRGLSLLRHKLEEADALRGLRVRNDGGDDGVAEGIDDEGRLRVRREDGVVACWVAGRGPPRRTRIARDPPLKPPARGPPPAGSRANRRPKSARARASTRARAARSPPRRRA